jgi:hypothetical protein
LLATSPCTRDNSLPDFSTIFIASHKYDQKYAIIQIFVKI